MSSAYKFCPRCAAPLHDQMLGGMPRRVCRDPACGFIWWDNPAPVVAALVERDGMIVLARNRAWPEKVFGLITGFLERDEDPAEAACREIGEELNLAADVASARLIGVYPFARKHEVIIAYYVIARGEIRLNEELAEYRLIAPEKLRAWDYGTGLAVRDWLLRRADPCEKTYARPRPRYSALEGK